MQRALLCCILLETVVHLSRGRARTLAFSLDLAALSFPCFLGMWKSHSDSGEANRRSKTWLRAYAGRYGNKGRFPNKRDVRLRSRSHVRSV